VRRRKTDNISARRHADGMGRCKGMRRWSGLVVVLWVAACSSSPAGTAKLTLNDPYWDKVNVEIVITKRADCDSRAEGYVETKEVVMRKEHGETIEVPPDATICWRHDRNPNQPVAGAWSGWTRATLQPGGNAQTDL
jgi:hypothetical protein